MVINIRTKMPDANSNTNASIRAFNTPTKNAYHSFCSRYRSDEYSRIKPQQMKLFLILPLIFTNDNNNEILMDYVFIYRSVGSLFFFFFLFVCCALLFTHPKYLLVVCAPYCYQKLYQISYKY